MPENKLQHYVPRAHLRPFCSDKDGAAINLFNVDRERAIANAPTKGQCARNYLYGKDGELERSFQGPEGLYAATVAKAMTDPESITHDDLAAMRTLMLLQTFRSYGYLEKQIQLSDRHDADLLAAAKGDRENVDLLEMTIPIAVEMALGHFFEVRDYIADLATVLVVNETRVEFVTSDDPAIHANRFHVQRRLPGGFGFSSSGCMLFLPLSPRLLLMSFDPHVYRVENLRGRLVEVRQDQDAVDLNELQHLHARHNIYFSDWEARASIAVQHAEVKGRRPDVWYEFRYFKPDQGDGGPGSHFVQVDDPGFGEGTGATMSMFSQVHVRPRNWTRLLSYKLRPAFIDTGTGAGVMRPEHPALRRPRRGML